MVRARRLTEVAATSDPPNDDVRLLELQREMKQPLLFPVDLAQIGAGFDLADLVADPLSDRRRLAVVDDDAFLLVEPGGPLVDRGDDRVQSEGRNPVPQH